MILRIGIIGVQKLANMYHKGAGEDLETLGYVEEAEREKGRARRYRILKLLPTKAQYIAELKDHYTRSMSEWWTVVESELRGVKDELTDWRTSMQSAGLTHRPKYMDVDEATDSLVEAIKELNFKFVHTHTELANVQVAVSPQKLYVSCNHRRGKKAKSKTGRFWRVREVCSILEAATEAATPLMNAEVRLAIKGDKRKSCVTDYVGNVYEIQQQLYTLAIPASF
jgi:hypothetical protein